MTAKHEINKDNNSKHSKVDGENPQGLSINHTPRPTGKWGMLRAEEIDFPKAQHTKRLSHTKWSTLKAYTPVTLYRLSKLHTQEYTCIYMHMYICNSNWRKKKKAMNLKESKKGYMERFGERKEKVGMLWLYYNLKNKVFLEAFNIFFLCVHMHISFVCTCMKTRVTTVGVVPLVLSTLS